MQFLEKLKAKREILAKQKENHHELDFLAQLWDIAFRNPDLTYELPAEFTLKDLTLNKDDVRDLFRNLNINVEIKAESRKFGTVGVSREVSILHTYRIVIKKA